MQYPKKIENLYAEELEGELCVYDSERQRMHALNPTAALVWQQCDGRTSPAELAGRLSPELEPAQADALVWLALDRLEKAHLLEQKVVRPDGLKISRRRALQTLGISALLPVVASLLAPAAAQAATCVGTTEASATIPGNCANPAGFDTICRESVCFDPNAYYVGCLPQNGPPVTEIKVVCCCPSTP